MNPAEIKRIVDELGRGISKENAKVSIQMYGPDPDEAFIVATERGYLRLGVKAGFTPYVSPDKTMGKRPHVVDVEMDYLITEDSVHFDYFERTEDIKIETYQDSWVDRVIPIAVLGAIFSIIALAIVGLMFITKTMRQTFIPILFVALTIQPFILAAQTKALSLDQVSEQVEGYIQESRAWKHETALPPTPPGAQPSPDVSIHFWSSEKCLTASLRIERKSYGGTLPRQASDRPIFLSDGGSRQIKRVRHGLTRGKACPVCGRRQRLRLGWVDSVHKREIYILA